MRSVSSADLCTIRDWARSQPTVLRVWLYGSRAKEEHREDSDIDLAIETAGEDEDEAQLAFSDLPKSFKRLDGFALSHVPDVNWYYPGADLDYVGPGVSKDGILIYERTHSQ